MRAPKERFDSVHDFLSRVLIDDLHAKRVLSLAKGVLGVMTGAALAVSLIGVDGGWNPRLFGGEGVFGER